MIGGYACGLVLSESVFNYLKLTRRDDASETIKFTAMFDRFFDCLNVNIFSSGKHKRKIFQDPYRSR